MRKHTNIFSSKRKSGNQQRYLARKTLQDPLPGVGGDEEDAERPVGILINIFSTLRASVISLINSLPALLTLMLGDLPAYVSNFN